MTAKERNLSGVSWACLSSMAYGHSIQLRDRAGDVLARGPVTRLVRDPHHRSAPNRRDQSNLSVVIAGSTVALERVHAAKIVTRQGSPA